MQSNTLQVSDRAKPSSRIVRCTVDFLSCIFQRGQIHSREKKNAVFMGAIFQRPAFAQVGCSALPVTYQNSEVCTHE